MKEHIYEMLAAVSVTAAELTDETHLFRDFGLDSLAFVRLLVAVENEYSISIGIGEMAGCLVVGRLIETVEKKTMEKQSC